MAVRADGAWKLWVDSSAGNALTSLMLVILFAFVAVFEYVETDAVGWQDYAVFDDGVFI